jgi:PAS domain S-box-containing protein
MNNTEDGEVSFGLASVRYCLWSWAQSGSTDRRRANRYTKLAIERMDSGDKILQAIFDHAALGIAQISLDGSLLRVNSRYCQMLGYSQSELLTRRIWDVTRPGDYDEVSIGRCQLMEGAISSHSMEKRYIRKDGSAFWGRLNRSLVRDQDNLPQYVIAVVEDITEKRQAEQALWDSEQRLRLALSTGVGVWEHDLRSHIPAQSPQYHRVFGRFPLTSEEWFKLVHPDDRERVMALIRESINGLSEWNAEFRLLYPDGSIRWMLSKGTVLLDDDGRPSRMAGVSIDITDRKRNEEALRRSEQRLELAQQVAGIGTWDWDLVTNKTHCSSGYGPLYGLPPGDVAPPPERWINLIYPEDTDRIREGLDRALTHTHRFSEEFRVVWPDGTIHWIYGEGQVFLNPEGSPIRMIGVNVDIDQRKRADAALRESEARFRNLADTAPVMIWVIGPDKRATFFNKRCIDFTGSLLVLLGHKILEPLKIARRHA